MTVIGTLSPFDRVEVTVMPAGSHERDMGDTVGTVQYVKWYYLLQRELLGGLLGGLSGGPFRGLLGGARDSCTLGSLRAWLSPIA